ncbi:protein kinase [Bacteroides sp. OttesenSCG-928-E20]|nr:protein kinase [Bacteroides sp. OttesenSCG-928-E20]MDL2305474.1 protein kinase [Bacteroides sp. OttesenSCG-928-D19]
MKEDEKTLRMESDNPEYSYVSTTFNTFDINGKNYKVVKIISDTSGEAQIYLLEFEDLHYVLKLYYPNFSPKQELLKILANINSDKLVRIFDYGFITAEGSSRCYELMEYLEGDSLDSYNVNKDENLFRKITFDAAKSLDICHKKGIIHRDVKLSNFFFRDKERTELVLGDFGISSLSKEDEDLHRTTQARTPIYAAPEMYMNVIDGEVELTVNVDFYSLGITLLCLWLDRNPFIGNERDIIQQKTEGKLPGIEELPEVVKKVIRGLTIVNPEFRWGYNEVERWYNGEDVPIFDDVPYLRYKRFLFDPDKESIARNAKELAALMLNDRMLGIRYLYNKRVAKWLDDSGNQKLSVVMEEIVEKYFPFDQSSGVIAAIYLLDPEQPFLFNIKHPTSTPKEIVAAFAQKDRTEDDFKALVDRRLLLWLSNKDEPDLYNEVLALTEGQKYSKALAYGVLYTLDKNIGFELGRPTNKVQVAELLNMKLAYIQTVDDEEEYIAALSDFMGGKDRLYYFSKVHGWEDVLEYRESCLSLLTPEGENGRLWKCDFSLVAYKFCSGIEGYGPARYFLAKNTKYLFAPEELEQYSDFEIKREIRSGKLKQWLSIFYHEKPYEEYPEKYSRDKKLAEFLAVVEKYNPTDYFAERFFLAREQQTERQRRIKKALETVQLIDFASFSLSALLGCVLMFLLNKYGISDEDFFLTNYFIYVCGPIALFGMLYFGIKSHNLSTGFVAGLLLIIFGGGLVALPAAGAYWLLIQYPEHFSRILVGLTGFYLLILLFFGLTKSSLRLFKYRKLYKDNIDYNVAEPLVFAYKTTVANFRSSNNKNMKEGLETIGVVQRKLLTFYSVWVLLLLIFVVGFVCFSPSFYGYELPGL